MFKEEITSINKCKKYSNYNDFLLDNEKYNNYNLFYIPNDQYKTRNDNFIEKTFLTIGILKYIDKIYDKEY
jgi:hypothetical protein